MTPHTQLILGGDGKDGKPPGDCIRTSVACLFDLDPTTVPHFLENGPDFCWRNMANWSRERGFAPLQLVNQPGKLLLDYYAAVYLRGVYHLIHGMGPRGWRHCVVGFGGDIVHDPHPSRAGLTEIEAYTLFVAVDPAKTSVFE